MRNLHAVALEGLLLAKNLEIKKERSSWEISNANGKRLSYSPNTGSVRVYASPLKFGRHVLRGSPNTIADILEGLIK